MTDSFIQVRTSKEDKEKASAILERLGTNLSSVVNMLIRQIIEKEGIPFDISIAEKDEKEKQAEEIRRMVGAFMPDDSIRLAMGADTYEDRLFYEHLGNYVLEESQKMAIERNLF